MCRFAGNEAIAILKIKSATVVLSPGRHNHPSEGLCITEAAALWVGERHSDHPESVCAALAAFGRVLNDALPDHARIAMLLPLLPVFVDSRAFDPTQAERLAHRRAVSLVLWATRKAAPAARAIAAAIIRHIITAAGAALVAHGYDDQGNVNDAVSPIADEILGVLIVCASAGFGAVRTRLSHGRCAAAWAALNAPPPQIINYTLITR